MQESKLHPSTRHTLKAACFVVVQICILVSEGPRDGKCKILVLLQLWGRIYMCLMNGCFVFYATTGSGCCSLYLLTVLQLWYRGSFAAERMFGTPTEETWPGVTTLYANLQTYPKFKPTVPNSHFSNELFDCCLCACLCNWVAPVINFYINVNSFLCFCLKISISVTVASCCSRATLAFASRCYYCFFS